MKLIATINEQLIAKAFSLVIPAAQQEQVCLLMLGSEGRGEQIQKTDQDNALILPDGLPWPTQSADLAAFSACWRAWVIPLPGQGDGQQPGLGEAAWRLAARDRAGLCARQRSGSALARHPGRCPGHHGRSRPARPVARHLRACLADRPDLLAEMARAAVAFTPPHPSLAGWEQAPGGAGSPGRPLPLVHGVRVLSLEAGILETSTTGRIEAPVARDASAGTMAPIWRRPSGCSCLRLRSQLQEGDGRVRVADLGPAERDLLRHALHQVKKFQQWLTLHFRLRQ